MRDPSSPEASVSDGLGCLEVLDLEVLVVVLALIVVWGVAWLVVELALPGLFFCAYLLVRSSLAHVANDRHACEGRLGRALRWGALWSAVVALPLAACVLLAHRLWRQPVEGHGHLNAQASRRPSSRSIDTSAGLSESGSSSVPPLMCVPFGFTTLPRKTRGAERGDSAYIACDTGGMRKSRARW